MRSVGHALAVIVAVGLVSAPVAATEDVAAPDLLPGVDLVTEEVEPGVYRVLSDGVRDLADNVWQVAVTSDGDVWVRRHRIERYRPGGGDFEALYKDLRVLRLGERGNQVLDDPLAQGFINEPDEAVLLDAAGMRTLNGRKWVDTDDAGSCRATTSDGSCWRLESERDRQYLTRTDAGGEATEFSRDEIGLTPGDGAITDIAASADGTVWIYLVDLVEDGVTRTGGLHSFDGSMWTRVSREEPHAPSGGYAHRLGVAPDGTVWTSELLEEGLVARSWDGESWAAYGPVRVTPVGAHFGGIAPTGIRFAPDGTIWFYGLTVFDGKTLRQVEPPASADNSQPVVTSVAYAPDGSTWLVVADHDPDADPVCPKKAAVQLRATCNGVTDGLYVITPEAVATVE